MGANTRSGVQREVVEHLEDAIDADDSTEKDFHAKQALQLLTVADADADADS